MQSFHCYYREGYVTTREDFYEDMVVKNMEVRSLIFATGTDIESPQNYGKCFLGNTHCR